MTEVSVFTACQTPTTVETVCAYIALINFKQNRQAFCVYLCGFKKLPLPNGATSLKIYSAITPRPRSPTPHFTPDAYKNSLVTSLGSCVSTARGWAVFNFHHALKVNHVRCDQIMKR